MYNIHENDAEKCMSNDKHDIENYEVIKLLVGAALLSA